MSSHHFVREGQEPALLVIDALPADQIGPLLEWAPLVIVHHLALENILSWGIKIDVVIAPDKEKDALAERLADQSPLKIVTYHPGEDALENALHFLIRSGQRAVNIVSDDIEQVLPAANAVTTLITVGVLGKSVRWSSVPGGKFEKWLPAGAFLQFLGTTSSLQVNGFPLRGASYQTARDGLISIISEVPFWVGEDL